MIRNLKKGMRRLSSSRTCQAWAETILRWQADGGILPGSRYTPCGGSDGIETDEGENELAPIRKLFNEWYARDISKKRRLAKIKGTLVSRWGQPPFGY